MRLEYIALKKELVQREKTNFQNYSKPASKTPS